ncbi:MAG: hypothetical protein IH868_00005, partial [Chloroflexi bacterium]|nr:hypothetical protein [Chloroflexota bacterium]
MLLVTLILNPKWRSIVLSIAGVLAVIGVIFSFVAFLSVRRAEVYDIVSDFPPFSQLSEQVEPDCTVEWEGDWYDAIVLETKEDSWYVHYIGDDDSYDEWVGKDRIRLKPIDPNDIIDLDGHVAAMEVTTDDASDAAAEATDTVTDDAADASDAVTDVSKDASDAVTDASTEVESSAEKISEGLVSSEDEEIDPPASATVEPDCTVEWEGDWYDAVVLKTKKDSWYVHYIGDDDSYDEWVGKDRIRLKVADLNGHVAPIAATTDDAAEATAASAEGESSTEEISEAPASSVSKIL